MTGSAGNRSPVQRFFRWWQAWVTHLFASALAAPRRLMATTRTGPETRSKSALLTWAAALALLIGAVVGVVLTPAGGARNAAILAAGMSLAWAPIRLLLMRLVATGDLASDTAVVRRAWGLGTLVWLLGITPELRGLAWAVSGAVTWIALERLGASRRQAGLCVSLAWGSQALVIVGSWLARNALIAVLATRG